MADLRASYPGLEDPITGAGKAQAAVLEGDAAAAKTAGPSLVAKDNTNALAYLQLTALGELKVATDAGGTCRSAQGKVAGSTSFQDIAVMTLLDATTYQDFEWSVACYRDCEYELYWVDDVGGADTETVLAWYDLTTSGDPSSHGRRKCIEFTSGTTSELRIRAKNENSTSDIRAAFSMNEG